MNKIKFILFIAISAFSLAGFSQTNRDSIEVRTDTLKEVEVRGQKELPVVDAIRKSMGAGLTMPKTKSLSDVIGKNATDKILHPFARKQRHKEKMRKQTEKILEQYDAVTSYEDELTAAIYRQMREDSIAAAKKKQEEIKK